ncbi:hypothetical protein D9M72_498090 [compost metagenome]
MSLYVPALSTPGAKSAVLMLKSARGARAPVAAICCRSGLSSISTSGRVLDDDCCRTLEIRDLPGTVSRLMVTPALVPQALRASPMNVLSGSLL